MNDQPKQRRVALIESLRQANAELARLRSGATQDPDYWLRQVADARQFMLLLDDDLNIRFVNRLREDRPDPVGRSVFDFLPAQFHDELRNAIDQARASGLPQYYELAARGAAGPDGELSRYCSWVIPLTDARAPDGLAVIAIDVTAQLETQEALESEKGVLQALVRDAPDHIVIVDRDHAVQFRNRDELGNPAPTVIGFPIEQHFAGESRQRLHDAIEAVFESAEGTSVELQVEAQDGPRWYVSRIGPVFRGGQVQRVSMVSTNITERMARSRAEARQRELLQQSEARFRTLVESAPEAVLILDTDSQRFVDVNANACTLFGMTRDQLLASGPLQISPPAQPDGSLSAVAAEQHIRDAMNGQSVRFEWTHRNLSGEALACEVRLVRLPDDERPLVRGSIIDIGERKRDEAERERLTHELAQSQKMQAIGQLTGGVAHDFNNLLTVIMSGLDMIGGDADDPERVRNLAGQALEAAQRAASLTQRLLAFARRQPLRPQVIDLNQLVANAEHLLRRTLGETITIETVTGDGLWPCESDPVQLENVILNLAINARDAMPDGGHLSIETANARLDRYYAEHNDDVLPGQYVMLAVSDNGYGMEPGVLRQAFEPFFTTKPTGEGSGLGLSMVYGFVKQSGGHVKIYSEPDAGSTVRIYLPRADRAARTPGIVQRPPETTPRGQGQRLLVVEDDDAVRLLVVEELHSLGYATIDAANGRDALGLLEHAEVDMILSDVVLPGGMNGTELAAGVLALRPGLPVLFMSGYTENAIIHNGRLDPGVNLLEKPFSRRQLAQAVSAALAAPTDD